MSKQVTMTMYVHKAESWEDKEYKLFQCDMSEHGYICLGPVEVSFTPPETDPVEVELESIDKAITALRADFQARLEALQERANNLLAITHEKGNDNDGN